MLKIFIVEDLELSSILANSFVARAEITVESCATGEELVERIGGSSADIALLSDAAGPSAATELCRRAREAGAIRVWWLGTVDDVAPVSSAGADQVFVRPLARETLLDAIAARLPELRRRVPRRRSRLQVDYFCGERGFVGYTRDVGVGGAFIRSRDAVSDGADLQVIFNLPERYGKTIRAEARVVRTVSAECDSYALPGVGVEFSRMGDRDRQALARYVADFEGAA